MALLFNSAKTGAPKGDHLRQNEFGVAHGALDDPLDPT
jgi:hypothetical protein